MIKDLFDYYHSTSFMIKDKVIEKVKKEFPIGNTIWFEEVLSPLRAT